MNRHVSSPFANAFFHPEDSRERFSARVAFVAGGFHSESSGVVRVMADSARALSRLGLEVTVFTTHCHNRSPARHLIEQPSRLIAPPGRWFGRLAWSPELKRALLREIPEYDVVHLHSAWMLPNHYASFAAARCRKPVLFTAHGVLEPWALARSRWKKRLVAAWFQNEDFRQATCVQALHPSEIHGIRSYGLTNPVALIPNGIDLTAFEALPDRIAFEQRYPQLANKRICLFLSRLHAKKGLLHLLDAWSRVRRPAQDWHLVLAGPDDGIEAEVRGRIATLKLADTVLLTGPLTGERKREAFGAADAFVLPSFSEGFSLAVLEAMACRLPVLITPGCNFPEVAVHNAGFIVEPTATGVEDGLRALLAQSDEDRGAMGAAGRHLVECHFTWERVATQLVDVYRWLVGAGSRPACVELS